MSYLNTRGGDTSALQQIPLYHRTRDPSELEAAPGERHLLYWPPAPDDVDANGAPVWTGTVSNGGLGAAEVFRAQYQLKRLREAEAKGCEVSHWIEWDMGGGPWPPRVWIYNIWLDCWTETALSADCLALVLFFRFAPKHQLLLSGQRVKSSGEPDRSGAVSRLRQLGLVISTTPNRIRPGIQHFPEDGSLYTNHTPMLFEPPPPGYLVVALDETLIPQARTLRRVEKALNTLLRKDVRLPDTPRHRNNAAKLAKKLERFAQGKGGDR